MKNHIPLGQVFGIRIWLSRFVLWMTGAVALINALQNPAFFWPTVIVIATGLSLVLLHELGHSWVAMRFGVNVSHITLWPLGGVAWMEEIPEDPKVEGLIAVAGPAVNCALALCAAPLLLIVPEASLSEAAVRGFVYINLALGVFNLLPAFPMDGGRILRSLLATKVDWLEATERAVRIGRSVALAAALVGLFKGYFLVPLIAIYVWAMGQKELFVMRAKKLGGGAGFSFANFAQAAGNPFAGAAGPAREEPGDPVFDASDGYEQSQTEFTPPAPSRGGFSEEDIRKLEGFRGRLNRNWKEEE